MPRKISTDGLTEIQKEAKEFAMFVYGSVDQSGPIQNIDPNLFRTQLSRLWDVEKQSISDESLREAQATIRKYVRKYSDVNEALQAWALANMSQTVRQRVLSRARQRRHSRRDSETASTQRIAVPKRLLEVLDEVQEMPQYRSLKNGDLLLHITEEWLENIQSEH